MYCKKLTLLLNGHVIAMLLAPLRQVSGWVEAGKSLEVMDKVGLIEITTGQRNLCPLERRSLFKQAEDLLEALDTAEQLGGQPHLFTEELDEPPLAEANILNHR